MVLTAKEMSLLKDLTDQEQLCVEKYEKYSQSAADAQLKTLFTQIGQTERNHLQTLNQIKAGTVPQMGQQQQGQQQGQQQQSQQQIQNSTCSPEEQQHDKYLCSDALATEKHVSAEYDTCIFEFTEPNIRNVLNHIQKEEQQHGERIYNYMSQHGMYN